MKLTELDPHWVTPDIFIFHDPLPKKRECWLSCKRVMMSLREQNDLFDSEATPEAARGRVTLTKPDYAWKFAGNDFETLTVTPSLDASASKGWHGFITNGKIDGGI